MFASDTIEGTRERAAVLALLSRAKRSLPWANLADAIEERGSALALLDELTESSDRLFGLDEERPPGLDEFEDMVAGWDAEGIQVITVLEPSYPINLRMVHDRPSALFIRGELKPEDERSIAIVGTRKATDLGRRQATEISHAAASANFVIVSGLAAGIDTVAHTTALDDHARTVAVIGTGHHHKFPKENAALQDRLGAESAVLSQFLPDQGARRWTFPMRNAVMSGFARATVVVEAGHTSGARMQARLAIEHGRPVFLVKSLLRHDWARNFAENRPGTYVIDEGAQAIEHIDRLYSENLSLSR